MADHKQSLSYTSRRIWRKHRIIAIILLLFLLVICLRMARPEWWFGAVNNYEAHRGGVMDMLGIGAFSLSVAGAVALEWMRRRVSTRFIGEFPDHLDRITAMIRSAGVRIDGLADCVDYG